jgi:predicted GTPase
VIIWDGGNNDLPFFRPDLWLCVTDPHRAGAETTHHPGDVNFRRADVVVVNKANTAEGDAVDRIRAAAARLNPRAAVVATDSEVSVADEDLPAIIGKRVVLVEDGPTLTHGGMKYGAGKYAAQRYGAEVVDPRPHLVGSLADTLHRYPHLGCLVPAMGYWPQEVEDLQASIAAAVREERAEAVLVASPVDLAALINVDVPIVRATYEIRDCEGEPPLSECLAPLLRRARANGGGGGGHKLAGDANGAPSHAAMEA